MRKTIPVALRQNPYAIVVDTGHLSALGGYLSKLAMGNDAVVITNPVVRRLHGRGLFDGLKKAGFSVKILTVPDGEASKSAGVAFDLMERIARYDCLKRVFVVAFGGGVIGDLAGYVAAAYKRGIPYVQVPTTFLAQIDSAIGGKVAVDLPVGKNLVGAFHQPKVVWSDVSVLGTLSVRQIRNGLAEALKYGVIADRSFFDYLGRHIDNIFAADPKVLKRVVCRCSEIKAGVVVADEKETRGLRTILNFGHTIGHAIEAAGQFERYQHGEAIALGMRAAVDISRELGLLREAEADRIKQALVEVGLPFKMEGIAPAMVMRLMRHDKKFISGKNRFVLARAIGKVVVREGVPDAVIRKAVKALM